MRRPSVAALALACAACKQRDQPAPPAPLPAADAIPRTTGPISIDGEWSEDDWPNHSLRRQFVREDGQLARPSSEVRLIRDATTLYVGLYAADEDIRSSDAFEISVGDLALRVDATGKPSLPDVQAAVDRDGTLDNASDDDEEWVLEVAIPLTRIGIAQGKRTQVHSARCDTPKDRVQYCGAWDGTLTLE